MDLFKGPALFLPVRLCIIIGALFVIALWIYNWIFAVVAIILLGIIYLFSLNQKKQQQWVLENYLANLEQVMDDAVRHALHGTPQQILIADREGRIHWWNKSFENWQEELASSDQMIGSILPNFDISDFWPQGGRWHFSKDERTYCADIESVGVEEGKEPFLAFYIQDVTRYDHETKSLKDMMPALAYIQIDNYMEVLQGMAEEERNDILLEAGRKLSAWASRYHGILKKVSEDSYIAIFSSKDMHSMKGDKVSILDDMRELEGENKIPVTLSIGIAEGDLTPALLNEKSQSALDLALGRGGDQAVVFSGGTTQFFGGKSKAVEKFTRVKARVVAQAIRELIRESDRVLIMGHRKEDFDAIGAALGMARISFSLGTPASILLSNKAPDMDQLRKRLNIPKEEMQDYFATDEEARSVMTDNTLVIVVDTHRPDSVAAPEVLEEAKKVVVIDHHRRTENFIANPHLIYLEPSSSSTSELVAELMTYLEERVRLTVLEANILYAGIVLDTKNFIIQTGSRTLEAASFLRRNGADPQLVQKLFWMDVEAMKNRAEAIANMDTFEEVYAISQLKSLGKDMDVIASQSADVMSTLLGMKASFVLYRIDEHNVGISARSQGEVNVQIIMEYMGGGGHQMVAAVQLQDISLEEAVEKLKESIRKYESES